MKNQQSVPKNKQILKKVLSICLFLFVFAISMGLFQTFSNLLLPASTQVSANVGLPANKAYFISVAKCKIESGAKSVAGDFQSIGAGGYVWQNEGQFHVVASVYEKETDANRVQTNIKLNHDIDSEIFEINFPSFQILGDFDADQKKVLTKSLKIFFSTYQSLFDIAVSLDTNVYNEISARLAVNNCYSAFNGAAKDFETLFFQSQDLNLQKLWTALKNGTQALEALCSGKLLSSHQSYSSLIKYHYTSLLHIYLDFLQ